MGLELLFLLLPVAALSGWLLGRRLPGKSKKTELNQCDDLSDDYFKGLNYLLNEQPDKAIEIFIHMLEVNSETVETHFALANLFRRRGEVERAIRIHQNLIARPTLLKQQRNQALYELGDDYLRAGLYDRAESLFQELVDEDSYGEQALQNLLKIYEQEKDWQQAVESAQRLKRRGVPGINHVIAHYYCEMAEEAAQKGEFNIVGKLIKRSLTEDKQCARASLLEGHKAVQAGDYKSAIKSFKRVEQQAPDYFSEAIPSLIQVYDKLGKPYELISELDKYSNDNGNDLLCLARAKLIEQQQGQQEAESYLTDYLHKHASLPVFLSLLNLKLAASEQKGDYQVVMEFISSFLDNRPTYRCSSCGFTAKALHWHCPSCKEWDTVKPIQADNPF